MINSAVQEVAKSSSTLDVIPPSSDRSFAEVVANRVEVPSVVNVEEVTEVAGETTAAIESKAIGRAEAKAIAMAAREMQMPRASTSSFSSDEISPRGVDAKTTSKAVVNFEDDEEEIEKRATDSGYESDRRKSFSSSLSAAEPQKTEGAVVSTVSATPQITSSTPRVAPNAAAASGPRSDRRKNEPLPRIKECRLLPSIPPLWPGQRSLPPIWPAHHHYHHQYHHHHYHHSALAIHRQAQAQALAHARAQAHAQAQAQAQIQQIRPLMPHPALQHKQAEAALSRIHPRLLDVHAKLPLPAQAPIPQQAAAKLAQGLPPVVLPLPICCKAPAVGPKEARKYVIPKYAVGFVIGHNGTRIQATRDVSGATVLLLGDKDEHHSIIQVLGTPGQIHDAVYLMKENIIRHSGMFIGDIHGMLKPVAD